MSVSSQYNWIFLSTLHPFKIPCALMEVDGRTNGRSDDAGRRSFQAMHTLYPIVFRDDAEKLSGLFERQRPRNRNAPFRRMEPSCRGGWPGGLGELKSQSSLLKIFTSVWMGSSPRPRPYLFTSAKQVRISVHTVPECGTFHFPDRRGPSSTC